MEASVIPSFLLHTNSPASHQKQNRISQSALVLHQRSAIRCFHLPVRTQCILTVATSKSHTNYELISRSSITLGYFASLTWSSHCLLRFSISFLRGKEEGCQGGRLPPPNSIPLWLGTYWDLGCKGIIEKRQSCACTVPGSTRPLCHRIPI